MTEAPPLNDNNTHEAPQLDVTLEVTFSIHFNTVIGDYIAICGGDPTIGDWDAKRAYKLTWHEGGIWEGTIKFSGAQCPIEYKYVLLSDEGKVVWEGGKNRSIEEDPYHSSVRVVDAWRNEHAPEIGYLYSALFQDMFNRPSESIEKAPALDNDQVLFKLLANVANVEPEYDVYITGSAPELGGWDKNKALRLSFNKHFIFQAPLKRSSFPFKFKLFITNKSGTYIKWEEGPDFDVILDSKPWNRRKNKEVKFLIYNIIFRRSDYNWRGAGIAIPIFSIRTTASMGIGEFSDLKILVDLCAKMKIKMIQILPINDTLTTGTYLDSYPYSSLSVFALNPLYLNIPSLTDDTSLKIEAAKISDRLNALPHIDHETVTKAKHDFIDRIYRANEGKFMDSQFKIFFEENKEWLVPYAVFKVLSEKYGTTEYGKWPAEDSKISKSRVSELSRTLKDQCSKIYFVQYNLHLQLKNAVEYAKKNHVGVKGDLPIGVNRRSVDCWIEPKNFNLDTSTGAPPDQFSNDGQNWGFPTYNWEVMKRDGFSWWRRRLQHMSNYFQAFRIDHILGFFRIWEIPIEYSSGLMGHFYPSIPIHRNELESKGIWDIDRLTIPFVTYAMLESHFGSRTKEIIDQYFEERYTGTYIFKEQYNTETKIIEQIDANGKDDPSSEHKRKVLVELIKNVVLLRQKENPRDHFFPRINMHKTTSYGYLDPYTKEVLWLLYIDYFYIRQESLWGDVGNDRLPRIKAASDMLVCGEDLGMLPNCIVPVMQRLSILSLRVQRMPPDPKILFGRPEDYPYMSVCTPSSHDCSTVRGWWEEDRELTQKFFNQILGEYGQAPSECLPWISKKIIEQHMWSPSMWAIFPIQDLFGLIDNLRVPDPKTEQINEPSNPKHIWRYRMHETVEDLLRHDHFISEVSNMVKASHRS